MSTEINTQPLNVYSGGKKVTEFSQMNKHHGNAAGQHAYKDGTFLGKSETFKGNNLVKDMVLKDKNGSIDVGVPSGVSGYAYKVPAKNSGGYGNLVEIKDKPDGKVIARFAHLKNFDSNLKEGAYISRGTTLGVQGHTGHVIPQGPGGTHVHAEMAPKEWNRYIKDLQTGKFTDQAASNQNEATQAAVSSSAENEANDTASANSKATKDTATDKQKSLTDQPVTVANASSTESKTSNTSSANSKATKDTATDKQKSSADEQAAIATFINAANVLLKNGHKFDKHTVNAAFAAVDKQNPNFVKQNSAFAKELVMAAAKDLQKASATAKTNTNTQAKNSQRLTRS
jgi:Peptidase family M23